MRWSRSLPLLVLSVCALAWPLLAQKAFEKPPHGQDRTPGPALTPEEAGN